MELKAKVARMPVRVSVELGTADIQFQNINDLGGGSVIQLNKNAGDPLLIKVNGMPYALGEAVIIDDQFGIRVTDILDEDKRAQYVNEYESTPYSEVWRK